MAKNAILIGKITRVAQLCGTDATEFNLDVKETQMDGTNFTIGTEVSCRVKNSVPHDVKTGKVCPVAVGDEITMEMEKHSSRWCVTSLIVRRATGRPLKEFLSDLEEELDSRNK
ncbi:MAG: hypothetical protein J6T72_01610 [Alphaproteobacteria bacterium]|nr:hypothetical protein [Alphaproteobacteria bacterium]